MPKLSKAQLDRNKNAAKLRQKTAPEKRKSLETPAEPDNVTQRKRKSFGLNTGFRESSDKDNSECDSDFLKKGFGLSKQLLVVAKLKVSFSALPKTYKSLKRALYRLFEKKIT